MLSGTFFQTDKRWIPARSRCSNIYLSAVPKGFVTPSNFSFSSSSEIWTEILTIRGYKLPSPIFKGEVQGTRLSTGFTHKAMFRATGLSILLRQTLRDKFFGGGNLATYFETNLTERA